MKSFSDNVTSQIALDELDQKLGRVDADHVAKSKLLYNRIVSLEAKNKFHATALIVIALVEVIRCIFF